jgi:hypothetical protein
MTGNDINVSRDLLPELLGSQDGLAKLVESVGGVLQMVKTSDRAGGTYADVRDNPSVLVVGGWKAKVITAVYRENVVTYRRLRHK